MQDTSPNDTLGPAVLLPTNERQDDEVSMQLRHLQMTLRHQVALNNERRARLYPRVYELMAFQEYESLYNNVATKVEEVYRRRYVRLLTTKITFF